MLAECQAFRVHCSRNEHRAETAERELKQFYVLRLLEWYVGDEYEGIVMGVTSSGIFVQLPEYLAEGLLRFSDLPDDRWEVDSETDNVIGQSFRTAPVPHLSMASRWLKRCRLRPGCSTCRIPFDEPRAHVAVTCAENPALSTSRLNTHT